MNDDLTIGDVTIDNGEFKIVTGDGSLATVGAITSGGIISGAVTVPYQSTTASSITIKPNFDVDDFIEERIMNRVTVDHKVSEQELMKLREVAPDYADEIKENIAKNLARDVAKKTTYTKKHDKDADVHHFIGRVWVFTEEELKKLILEARNV